MNRFFRFLTRHPWWILLATLLLSAGACARLYDFEAGRLNLRFDPSANRLLPESDPAREFYDRSRKIFGNDESMLIAVHMDDIFTPAGLEALIRLTEKLEVVEGVHHVTSLYTAQHIRGTDDGLDIRPLFDEIPDDPAEFERLRAEALDNPIFTGNLISEDSRTAIVLVNFLDFSDREFVERGIDAQIQAIADAEAEAERGAQVWVTGASHIKVAQIATQTRELANFIPLIFGVLALVLALSFRTLRGVVLPILTIAIAVLWSMGVAAWIGKPFNLVTILVPLLMIILGLSYAVHVVSEYYDEARCAPDRARSEVMAEALAKVWLPVCLTGLTTCVGFFALALSPMAAIREFGVLSLVGVAAAVLASLVVTPSLLVAFGRGSLPPGSTGGSGGGFRWLAETIGHFDLSSRREVIGGAALLFVVAIVFGTQLRAASDSIASFAPHVPVRMDFEAINEHIDGANSFDIVIEASYKAAFKDPENLRELEGFQHWLDAQPEIGGTTSLVDFIQLMHRGFFADGDEGGTGDGSGDGSGPGSEGAHRGIPDSERIVGQLLFFGHNDDLESYVDSSHRVTKLAVRTSIVDSSDLGELTRRIERRAAELPAHMAATVTGNRIVIQGLVDDLVRSQIRSLGIALAMIWLILSLLFLSARTGFIALLPNLVPISVFFGGLGLFDVPLNFGTSLIAPMVLGIAIDDTIHYFTRFHDDAKRLADENKATVRALEAVGRPVTYTTLAICLGFLVLTLSDLRTWQQFGSMGAFTLAAAWVIDITLTPALCSGLRVATVWDTIRLDLGDNPERSIPLFDGLKGWECRMAAQIATLRNAPAGAPLIRTGDQGREMYLVIDGELRASILRPDGQREVLNTHHRGDVIGEVGFFFAKRSADVDVIEPARLLRLTQKNMAKLANRYPRIASKVFRNLNRIMAERLSNTTERLRH